MQTEKDGKTECAGSDLVTPQSLKEVKKEVGSYSPPPAPSYLKFL